MIQQLWNAYLEANPTNNMMERKVMRMSFMAGALAMQDQTHQQQRLSDELIRAQSLDQILPVKLVIDNDK